MKIGMLCEAIILLIFGQLCLSQVCIPDQASCAWTLYDDELYFVSQTEMDYPEARATCQIHGGDLAVIKSREQNNFLFGLLPAGAADYWIGLTDLENNGTYRWVDGTSLDPSLPIWGPDQPNGRNEHCIRLISRELDGPWHHKWGDLECQDNVRYICSRSFVLPVLSKPPTLQETGTNHAVVAWQPWQDTPTSGERPACGYWIYFRLSTLADNDTSWTLAGYRAEQVNGTGDLLVFNVTGLESGSEYEIAITVVHLCTGREGNKGPSVEMVTRSKDNTERLPDSPCDSITPLAITHWALLGISVVFNVLCGIIIAALCLGRKRPGPSKPVDGTSMTSGLSYNPTFKREEGQYQEYENYCRVV